MIGHKSPRVESGLRLLEQIPKPIGEALSIGVILEYRPPLASTNDNVLHRSGGIYSGLARILNP